MGVLNHQNLDQLDMLEKVVEKVVMGGASRKDNYFALYHNIETTPPQLDNTQRLYSMIDEIPKFSMFELKQAPQQPFMLHKSVLWNF